MKIVLHGNLKDLCKNDINLDVNGWYQVYSALCSIIPGFRKSFESNTEVFIVKVIGAEKIALNENTIAFPLNCDELHIIPSINGSGIEMAVAMWVGGQLVAAGMGAAVIYGGMALAYAVTWIAIRVAIGYVISQLAPTSEASGSGSGAEKRDSFFFNGATNITRPGTALPLIYGRILAGTVVVSIGSEAVDLPVAV